MIKVVGKKFKKGKRERKEKKMKTIVLVTAGVVCLFGGILLAEIAGLECQPSIIVAECTSPPIGDLDNNCMVDFQDFAVLAAHWLEEGSSKGSLNISKDASSPISDIVIGGKTATLAVFRLAADNVEDLDLDALKVSFENGGDIIDSVYFYQGDTLLAVGPGNDLVIAYFEDGTVIIPANDNVKIIIKAKFFSIDGTVVKNNTPIKTSLNTFNAVETTGLDSARSISSGSQTAKGNTMKLYKSRPYFNLNAHSPLGELVPDPFTLVAVFDVTADPGGDISFKDEDLAQLSIRVTALANDIARDYVTFTLIDNKANLLGLSLIHFTGLSPASIDGALIFDRTCAWGDFVNRDTTNSWVVPAGQTKKLYVLADATDFEDDGDAIQVWLDDNEQKNCVFGIDGDGTYLEGQIIFRGDINAGLLVNLGQR